MKTKLDQCSSGTRRKVAEFIDMLDDQVAKVREITACKHVEPSLGSRQLDSGETRGDPGRDASWVFIRHRLVFWFCY